MIDEALGQLAEESVISLSVDGNLAVMHRLTALHLRDSEHQPMVTQLVLHALESFTTHNPDTRIPSRAWAEHLVDQIDAASRHSPGHETRTLRLREWAGTYRLRVGEYDRAISTLTDVVTTDGASVHTHGRAAARLIEALARAEQFDQAVSLQEQVLADSRTKYGEDDVGHVVVIRSRRSDDAHGTTATGRRLSRRRRPRHGETTAGVGRGGRCSDHARQPVPRERASDTRRELRRHDEALAVCVDTLDLSSPEERTQATALGLRSELAELYDLTGHHDRARTTATEVARDAEIMYGADHVITRSCQEKLANLTAP